MSEEFPLCHWGARIVLCQHGFDEDGATAWQRTDGSQLFPHYSPLDHVCRAIRADGQSPARFTRITVAEGGASATLFMGGWIRGNWFGAELAFCNNDAAAFPGIRRLVEIEVEPVIGALHESIIAIEGRGSSIGGGANLFFY